ncbi:NitT/TauT family transport system permease protein [Alkalibaculum bacchi]|uniref:NitT/TauT family transport system permease protein n=2 Tax=Alkalibaculum bacchi TaxID=645887 RepID=A0A366IAT8_9FIRM|nr:ABC transporter permease [Alkalibaculum bacchi]RBP65293.1 NitT/TauT family transport system permease protein [Alkalibaculum bacchi]
MNIIKKSFHVLVSISVLVGIWQIVCATGRYEPSLLPSPMDVVRSMKELLEDGTLILHIQVSMTRFLIGYITASIAGIVLGLILGWYQKLWAFIDPIVQVLRPISPIAWFPFIVLWFGIGDAPAIVIIFIAAFYPVLLSTVNGIRKVDQVYLKVAQNFEMNQFQLLTKIVLPAAFPIIANGLHMALGSSWVFLVAGEMVGAQSGLGYLIIDARNSLRLDLVLAGIIFIGLSGLILDMIIKKVEKNIESKWGVQNGSK